MLNKVKEGTIAKKATEVLLQNKVLPINVGIYLGAKHDNEIEPFVVLILCCQSAYA